VLALAFEIKHGEVFRLLLRANVTVTFCLYDLLLVQEHVVFNYFFLLDVVLTFELLR